MLTMRMARVGKRNKAQFKIMLQESTVAPGGRHVEVLGSYDPHQKTTVLKEERIKYWLSKGVQASDTVHNLLVAKGMITDKKRVVKLPKKAEEPKTEEAKTESADAEAVTDKEVKEEKKVEEKVFAEGGSASGGEEKIEGVKKEEKPAEPKQAEPKSE